MNFRFSKLVASSLSTALIAVAPGLAPYEAWAQSTQARPVTAAAALPAARVGAVTAVIPTAPAFSIAAPASVSAGLSAPLSPAIASPVLSSPMSAVSRLSIAPALAAQAPTARLTKSAPLAAVASDLRTLQRSLRSAAAPASSLGASAGRAFDVGARLRETEADLSTGLGAPVRLASGRASLSGASAFLSARGPWGPPGRPSHPPAAGIDSKGLGYALFFGAGGASLAAGFHVAAGLLWPALFGGAHLAGVWSVASGAILLPIALAGRLALARRPDAMLHRVRAVLDVSIGAFLASAAFALNLAPIVVPPGGGVALGSLFALGSLAAMTTTTFFLAHIVGAVKAGAPLKISSSSIVWPAYFWTGLGAYFAFLSGFSATGRVVQAAFAAWMFLGGSRYYDLAYLAAFAASAAMGWASPLTFVVLAYFPERAAKWTTVLLEKLFSGRILAKPTEKAVIGEELDSFSPPYERDFDFLGLGARFKATNERLEREHPNFHYGLNLTLRLGALAGFLGLVGYFVFGVKNLLKNLLMSGLLTFITFWNSGTIVIKAMNGQKADPVKHADLIQLVREVAEEGGLPMPEVYIIPTDLPNAFATGRSPAKAVVGVTEGILKLLDRNELKAVLGHEMKGHIAHRHMVYSTITGAAYSAVSFCEQRVLWAMATAKEKAKAAFDKLRGRAPRKRAALMDPVTGGIALSSAGLVAGQLALWAPLCALLLQMSTSRQCEFQADEASGHPRALASSLSKLMNWRPKGPFRGIELIRLPLVASTSHLFTVPMLPMFLRSHGMESPLPKDGLAGRMASWMWSEDFLFSQFVSHPRTQERIRRLDTMPDPDAEARDRAAWDVVLERAIGRLKNNPDLSGK